MKRRPHETARQRFARRVKQLRMELGLSQDELGFYSGLHRTYIGSVERAERNISIDSMERIALALGRDIIELLERQKAGKH